MQIIIQASPERLWDVLTKATFTKQYMFNCAVSTDWEVGSPITWSGNFNGYEAFQKGEVIDYQPFNTLCYSTFDPNFGLEDKPENYIQVRYELFPDPNGLKLVISNETFDGNEERMQHIQQGWGMVIDKIKEVAEATS
jgi:uncharacterized protein YndB with AHSA1/START domain